MRMYMRYILSGWMIILLSACDSPNSKTVESELLYILNQPANQTQQYKACIFLAELPTSDQILKDITYKSHPKFCKSYLLAKYHINDSVITHFINEFPEGNNLKKLWHLHSESGYIFGVIPPAIKLLSNYARQNDIALDKLVQGLNITDGAHSESLIDIIAGLYKVMPIRVEHSFKRTGLDSGMIKYIKDTSGYKK